METAEAIIARLGLAPHPEGGWYRETWAGALVTTPGGLRSSGTAILFLLQAGERSHWHKVDATEIWLFHAGTPLTLRLSADGQRAQAIRLGPDVLAGDQVQALVPGGQWQAAQAGAGWALVSCVVSPGFRFAGFDLAPPGFDIPG